MERKHFIAQREQKAESPPALDQIRPWQAAQGNNRKASKHERLRDGKEIKCARRRAKSTRAGKTSFLSCNNGRYHSQPVKISITQPCPHVQTPPSGVEEEYRRCEVSLVLVLLAKLTRSSRGLCSLRSEATNVGHKDAGNTDQRVSLSDLALDQTVYPPVEEMGVLELCNTHFQDADVVNLGAIGVGFRREGGFDEPNDGEQFANGVHRVLNIEVSKAKLAAKTRVY